MRLRFCVHWKAEQKCEDFIDMEKELFGITKKGEEIYRYWLKNSKGMKAGVINYGAILVNLMVPDKNG